MSIFVLLTYGTALMLILVYSIMQLTLVINYRRNKKRKDPISEVQQKKSVDWPFVTIQLPIYNERYVVERLIDAVSAMDYPADRFEIQVLDDSIDDTIEISESKVREVLKKGIQIQLLRRSERIGYKAGALDYGLKQASGEYIAIFDADFIPDPEFLKKTIPAFLDPKTGVVQTRWGHINKDYSLLTKLQAFGLDAHFTVEQNGRNAGGHFINFNGTAGIWRKDCINDAGGWEYDTLTEDLDLSYRAQLKGWKFKYLESVVTPAELPVVMSALKNQQFRWTKGGAENFVKMFRRILKHKTLPFKTKVHGIFHLFNSAIYLCVFITALFSVPILFIKHSQPQYEMVFNISSLFLICTTILMLFYWTSYQEKNRGFFKSVRWFLRDFFLFLSASMGLSLHNSVAVIEGYTGKKSAFIRTPKFNILQRNDRWKNNAYMQQSIPWLTFLEGLMALYFLFAIICSFVLQEYGLFPFHVMLFWGFSYIFWLSVRQLKAGYGQ